MSGPRDDYTSALVELVNALNDWRDAGGDVLKVTAAIQRFVFVLLNEERRRAEIPQEPGG